VKKGLLLLALATVLLLLNGCASQTADPLLKNEATDAPGLAMNLPPALVGSDEAGIAKVTLYYRYLDEPMLAGEARDLTVPKDESVEFAIVQALTEGPSAGHSDLRRLLPAGTQVESVVSRGNTLFVTFNSGFLDDGIPAQWADDPQWKTEAPLKRWLTVQSIVASVTEYHPYAGIQILVHRIDDEQNSLRLDNAYFLNGATGLSEPIARDETVLLTAGNTAEMILLAWQQRDDERLYRYVMDDGKPPLASFSENLQNRAGLKDFSVSGGSVSVSGTDAVVTVSLKIPGPNGEISVITYPLALIRDNGIWKITYSALQALMEL
jgi:hypothetical protein